MHLFPWTRRRARRQAIAEAQAKQRADYDRAVQRITSQDDAPTPVEIPTPRSNTAPDFIGPEEGLQP
jgi:hypothetical protein